MAGVTSNQGSHKVMNDYTGGSGAYFLVGGWLFLIPMALFWLMVIFSSSALIAIICDKLSGIKSLIFGVTAVTILAITLDKII